MRQDSRMSDHSSAADLIAVRVIDLREPPRVVPSLDTEDLDQRYPSPRRLRMVAGFVIDLVLHLGISMGAAITAKSLAGPGALPFWILVGGFLGLSIVHRVIVQWYWRTTVGKWLTGLCLVSADTGDRPTLWQLIRAWWLGLWRSIAAPFSLP
jgi:RDD family protein